MAKLPWYSPTRWFGRETPTILMRPLSADERQCPACDRVVTIWRTYSDGTIRCVECAP